MSGSRGLWLAVMILASAMLGAAGGTLARMGGAGVPQAVLTGAAGFGASVLLMIAMASFLDAGQTSR
ncbi:hypothetical protein [Streptomyces sp. NPDC050504]|uniref:hypothetical protein n=1 Tax=Streptomyces sp. NPDC050504 TaxID=3365618 RepID=UPI0037A01129